MYLGICMKWQTILSNLNKNYILLIQSVRTENSSKPILPLLHCSMCIVINLLEQLQYYTNVDDLRNIGKYLFKKRCKWKNKISKI